MRKTPSFHAPFAAATLAAVLALAAPLAHALPGAGATCRITTYYADASMTTKVGSYSTCPGSRGLTGRKTAFFDVDDVEIEIPQRPQAARAEAAAVRVPEGLRRQPADADRREAVAAEEVVKLVRRHRATATGRLPS